MEEVQDGGETLPNHKTTSTRPFQPASVLSSHYAHHPRPDSARPCAGTARRGWLHGLSASIDPVLLLADPGPGTPSRADRSAKTRLRRDV